MPKSVPTGSKNLKMDRFQWYILLVTLAATTCAFQCPDNKVCSCQLSHSGDYEIHCPANNDSAFVVNIQPNQYVQVQCHNFPKWSDFHLGSSTSMKGDLKFIHFRMCSLPNSSLSEITEQLGVDSVESLIFQSYGNLSSTLKRNHLKGFTGIKKLILSSNSLTELTADLLQDLPELTWLDLRENSVRLPTEIFDSVPKLEVLELGNNMIEAINPEIFSNLTRLRFLNLWKNQLNDVKPHTFDKLTSLESLDINTNKLTTLPFDIFDHLRNLKTLNMFGNNFSSLPENLLVHNTKLRVLNFYNNRQNLTTLPSKFLSGLSELREVRLKRNGLQYLPEDMFWGTSSLVNLSIERNYLSTLPEKIFRDLNELNTLDLSFNELTFLPDGLFAATVKLYKLDLAKNHLTAISGTFLSGLNSLRILNLEENKLTNIHDQAFSSLQNLQIARFSYNELTLNSSLAQYRDDFGTRSPFHYCTAIEELHLAHNNISEIFSDWVISAPHLRLLDLKYNQLSFIETADLQFVSGNINVDLTHNNISHILLRRAELFATAQDIARNVIILIEDNPILCDCYLYDLLQYLEGRMHPNVQNLFHIKPGNLKCRSPTWLENIAVADLKSKSLKCLIEGEQSKGKCPEKCACWLRPYDKAFLVDCSYRNLTKAPEKINEFDEYHTELNLTGNFLKNIPYFTQPGYKTVTKLFLSHNNISSVSLNTFSSTLEILELHNNNLTRVDSDVLEFMRNSSLIKLTLHENPWKCDCEAREFLSFIQTKFMEIPELLQITCSDLDKPISEMTASELCPVAIGMVVGISLTISLLGLIIGILAALYYRYQQEVKVWLYAHQLCLWFVTEDELDKNKLYDAFISYSHKDEDFVVNQLVSQLEQGPTPFKLCIHFRDWLAGEWIPEQIARSVEDSKRTIVVLSPNFLESIWGRLEFRAAHSQALSEGRARVIVILYGDIGPTDNLDPELKAYLSMNTYVKWGDPWFWDKLRYALPHPAELIKRNVTKKIFEKHQPRIQLNGEKNELIHPAGVPVTPPAVTTPPADSIKTFTSNGCLKGGCAPQIETGKLNGIIHSNLIADCESVKDCSMINVHCTTVV